MRLLIPAAEEMNRIIYFLKTLVTIGRGHQSFIGAGWISLLLRLSPKKYKTRLALWVLSLSPHYFVSHSRRDYEKNNYLEYLELERKRNEIGREKILQTLLLPYLEKMSVVIDYGCGAGFLAKHVSGIVDKVYACDISGGALECAGIINQSPNLIYLNVKSIEETIPDKSIDLAYSFAVIQHITDDALESILRVCYNKLKNKGTAVFHIPLAVEGWKSEKEWREDKTLFGRIKWKYGLNYFSRTQKQVTGLFEKYGFESIQLINIRDVCEDFFDNICNQQLFVARRKETA